jgi:hypothetical protein
LKFKVDEIFQHEYAPILREADFEADTVCDEELSGAGDSMLSERLKLGRQSSALGHPISAFAAIFVSRSPPTS